MNFLTKCKSFSRAGLVSFAQQTSRYSSGGIQDSIDTISGLTKEQIELRSSVRSFVEKELPQSVVQKMDKEDNYAEFRSLWQKLGKMGFHGMTVPNEYSGLNLGYLEHCIVMEEISRVCGAIGLSYGAHSNLCINQLKLNGSKEQKDKYLDKLVSGELIGALAMSETTAGSDVTSMKISAKRDGKHYILNGQKFWITNGSIADLIFVYAKTGPNEITAFLVEKNFEGFSVGQKIDKLGMRGSPTAELLFDNCRVPEENIVGGVGSGVYVLMSGLDYERLVLSAGPLGLMQMACEQAFDYCHNRKQFSSEIAKFQLVQGKMADMYVNLNVCRSYVYSVARAIDESRKQSNTVLRKGTSNFTKDCAGVILFCAEKATQSCLDAVQLLGGNGYTNEYIVGRLLRDAKLYEIGAGTSEIRRWLIGRELNKHYLSK